MSSTTIRRASALVLLALSGIVVGCSVDPDDDVVTGDGETESDFVSERQITGSELPSKTVALTFDDGPGNRTSELANFLADQGIHSTFFINGMRVPGRQGALNTVVGRGHMLANHTQHHLDLKTLPVNQIVSEVADTDAIINLVQPGGPRLLRAPFGSWNGTIARILNASGESRYVGSIFWDAGGALTDHAAADWDCWGKKVSIDRCADLYMEEIRQKNHGIVLMHDIHDQTIDLVYRIVPRLKAEGFSFAGLLDAPAIKRAVLAPAPIASQCASATLGYPVNQNVCVQSRATKEWSRCIAGDWYPSNSHDQACASVHPLPPDPPVTVTWSAKSPTATYSLDVQTGNGSWAAPCVNANVLQQNLSTVLDSKCPSSPIGSIDMPKMRALRLCWAENNNWGAAKCEETPYRGELSIHVGQ